jgi:hypothetical protein
VFFLTVPPFDTARSMLPSSMHAAVIQALILHFPHPGIATVRTHRTSSSWVA